MMSRWCGYAAVLLALLAVLPARAVQPVKELSLAGYRALVTQSRQAAQAKNADEIAVCLARAEQVSRVNNAGVVSPAGTGVLLRALVLAGKNNPNGAKQLQTLEAALGAAPVSPTSGNPQKDAKAILTASEFDAARVSDKPVAPPTWWDSFKAWVQRTAEAIRDWFADVFKSLFGNRRAPDAPDMGWVGPFAQFVKYLLYFLLGAGALIGLFFLLRIARERGWLGQRRTRRSSAESAALDLTGDGIADPLGAARALAAGGDHRGAVRLVYIAALRRLQAGGLLQLDINRTNWEYQRALRAKFKPAHDTLLPATRLFDRVWYGRQAATQAEYEALLRVHDALGSTTASGAETETETETGARA